MSNPEEITQEVEDHTVKVFAGNLSFGTTEDNLREIFAEAGEVVTANIIRRYNRSLGYGFVTFNTEAEAQKAVDTLDKKEVDGRAINVEVAKPKAAPGERKERTRRPRRARAEGDEGAEGAEGTEGAAPRRRNNRRRKPAASESGDAAEHARIDQVGDESGAEGAAKPQRRRRRPNGRKPSATGESEGEGAAASAEGEAAPAGRRRRTRRPNPNRPPQDGPLSKTTLFIANLPFKVDNEKLAAIFKDYSVKSAKVITLKNGRSKGFGFVEVEDENEQARVLEELQNVQVDGRELVIKVALQASEAANHAEAEPEEASA
ncbi:hypothetical protein HDV05_000416 [Chytridiales sp. JEL 0842]|nr:hypothetical protein HDV05_000416 [Chytridiales sp. JEL 0842]